MMERWLEQLRLLPELMAHHVALVLLAMACGLAMSVPVGVWISRRPMVAAPVLAAAGVIQTIPSLALLALMVPLLGMIGFWPAWVALVLYSVLPVLRNTVTGLHGVDAGVREAAKALGMTSRQRLFRVEFPLALPTIVAGVRTAAVWVVGIATLATPVGAKCLGEFIFTGLRTRNTAAVIVGCVSAAALALVLDGAIRLIESAATSRRKSHAFLGGAIVGLLCIVALVPVFAGPNRTGGPRVVVGAKTFTEQYILADWMAAHLRDEGFDVEVRTGMGSQILFDALAADAVDVYVDYTGTIWANVMKRDGFPPKAKLLAEVKSHLKSEFGIECVGPVGFENTYALAVSRALSEQRGMKSISDLARVSGELSIGGDVEFFGRPEWKKLLETYSMSFGRTVGMDASLMYEAARQGQVDVVCAFSTDGRLAAYDLVVLEDDRRAFPPYDAILLASPRATANGRLMETLAELVGSIDDESMRNANRVVDVDGGSVSQAAATLSGAESR